MLQPLNGGSKGALIRRKAMGDSTARAVAWLSTWDSQGTHRTGTMGEEAYYVCA
jgi:hypothetical protein